MADITPDTNTQQYGPSSVDTGGNIPQTTTDAPNPDYTQYNKDVPAIQAEGQGIAPQGQPAPQAQPQAPQPQQPNQAPEGLRPVTSSTPTEQHPSVQRAGWVHDVAETLSGGPRYKYDVDPNTGEMKKTPVPVSGKHLALAIALEALQGSLTGLAAGRGKGPGAAGAAAMAQQQAQQQAIKDRAQAQAQQEFKNKTQLGLQQAQIAETNSRTILNTRNAEKLGVEALKDATEQNQDLFEQMRDQGIDVDNTATQDELMDGMKSGRYNATAQLGPINGYKLVNGHPEALHVIVQNPNMQVQLSQKQWDDYSGKTDGLPVPGFSKTVGNIGTANVTVAQMQGWNEIKSSMKMEQLRNQNVKDALAASNDPAIKALAERVPAINTLFDDPQNAAGLTSALQKYQKYTGHHDVDTYEALVNMRDQARTFTNAKGEEVTNPHYKDAKYANQVADAFGGWDVLRAYHNETSPKLQALNKELGDYATFGTQKSTASVKTPYIKDTAIASYIDQSADRYEVDKNLARAVALTESGNTKTGFLDPNAVNPKSGATGLFQFMPDTAKEYGLTSVEDMKNPTKNIDAGVHYLSDLLNRPDINGDVDKALKTFGGFKTADPTGYIADIKRAAGINETAKVDNDLQAKIKTAMSTLQPRDETVFYKQFGGKLNSFLDGDPKNNKPSTAEKMASEGKADSGSVARIMSAMDTVRSGGISGYQQARETQNEANKAAGAVALEAGKAGEADKRQAKVEAYLQAPPAWHPDPELLNRPNAEETIIKKMQDQNIPIPPWAIGDIGVAQGKVAPERMSTRQYKDVGKMDAMEHEAWIHTFVDPGYSDSRFKDRNDFILSLNPGKQPGTVLYNAGTAVAHAQLGMELFQNLNNRQSPVWNRVANEFGANIMGMAAPEAYKTVTHALANEVAKVTQGPGVTAEQERLDWQKRFDDSKSPEAAAGVLQSAMGLMAPRLGQLIQDAQQHHAMENINEHIHPQTLEAFSQAGISIPGFGYPNRVPNVVKSKSTGQIVGFKDPETHEWVAGGPDHVNGWRF